MLKKGTVLFVMTLTFTSWLQPATASTWSDVDPNAHMRQSDFLIEHKAWEIDLAGNKTEVKPLDRLPKVGENGAEYFDDGTYTYYWSHYEPWNNAVDRYRFHVGTMTYGNRSNITQSMTYKQSISHTSEWTTVGKVSVEASFGSAILANAKFAGGFEVQRRTTTSQGAEYSGNGNVAPWHFAELSLYDAATASSGQGIWAKYTRSGTLVGAYAETGGAWTVAENYKNFIMNQYPL